MRRRRAVGKANSSPGGGTQQRRLGLTIAGICVRTGPYPSPSPDVGSRREQRFGHGARWLRPVCERNGPSAPTEVGNPHPRRRGCEHDHGSGVRRCGRWDRSGEGGFEIIDTTDPSKPVSLTRIPCPGYQSDIAVHETVLLQAIDSAQSNTGCNPRWLEASGSAGVDRSGTGGVRIFDVTDPARPRLVHFVEVVGKFEEGVHNLTVLPWAGVAYLAELDGELGIVDLEDAAYPYTTIKMSSISPEMDTSCHDVGLDPVRLLAFCPGFEYETYVLDVSDPMRPTHVSTIVNEALSRHHGARIAPDGVTLVLEAEYDHPPEVESDAPAGFWFYDLREPAEPELLGSWAPNSCVPTERAERACTSHWFNFVPGTRLVAASWRHHGVFIVDYTDPANPVAIGSFQPGAGPLGLGGTPDFWSAYFWHGHVYASAGDFGGGLYVLGREDFADTEPSPYDEGTSWGRRSADSR